MKMSNGTVLPVGLVSEQDAKTISAFNRNFNNFTLKVGVVVKSYDIDKDLNKSKVVPEYDVIVLEQNAHKSITPTLYRNCIYLESFGSIADYFEARLRAQKNITNPEFRGIDKQGQDGAIVIIACIDGKGNAPIILGSLKHPDRESRITNNDTLLAGEYNGISIKIFKNGAGNLTFKGETDTFGKPVDESQGTTTIDIEKDGTFMIKHQGVTYRLEKKGDVLLKNEENTTVDTKKNINFTAGDNFNLNTTNQTFIKTNNFVMEAQDSAKSTSLILEVLAKNSTEIKTNSFSLQSKSVNIQASQTTINGNVALGGSGGQPLCFTSTKVLTIGNLGIPAIGNMIGPFTVKTVAK